MTRSTSHRELLNTTVIHLRNRFDRDKVIRVYNVAVRASINK